MERQVVTSQQMGLLALLFAFFHFVSFLRIFIEHAQDIVARKAFKSIFLFLLLLSVNMPMQIVGYYS